MSPNQDLEMLAAAGDPDLGLFPVPAYVTTRVAESGFRGLLAGPLGRAGIVVGQSGRARDEAAQRELLRQDLIARIDAVRVKRVRANVSSIKGGGGKTRNAAGLLISAAAFRQGAHAIGLDVNPDMGILAQAVGALFSDASERSIMTFLEAVQNGNINNVAELLEQVMMPGPRDLLGRPQNVGIIASAPLSMRDDEMAITTMIKIIEAAMVYSNVLVADCGTGLRSPFNYGTMAASNAWVLVATPTRLGFEMALRAVQTYDGTGLTQPPTQYQAQYKRLAAGVVLLLNRFDQSNPSHQYWLQWYNLVFPGRVIAMPYDVSMDEERAVVLRSLQYDTMDAFLRLTLAVYECAAAFEGGGIYQPAPPAVTPVEALAALKQLKQRIVAGPDRAADADVDAAVARHLAQQAELARGPRRRRHDRPRRRRFGSDPAAQASEDEAVDLLSPGSLVAAALDEVEGEAYTQVDETAPPAAALLPDENAIPEQVAATAPAGDSRFVSVTGSLPTD